MSKAIRYFDKAKTFFDGSSIAAGYKLFQYQAGGSTKANTFTTAAKSVANANPMTLNADGRLDQDVYIDQSMKFVVATLAASDPPSSNIYSIDNAVANAQVWATSSKSGTYQVLETDRDKLIKCDASGGIFTVTLVAAATAGDGFRIAIKKTDSSTNAVTVDGNASETIDGGATFNLAGQQDSVLMVSDGSNWQIYRGHGQTFLDTNGNEVLLLSTTASAVNEFTMANAASGNGPALSVTGGDTNIDLNITPKGTGNVNVASGGISLSGKEVLQEASSSTVGEVKLYEDTDNGAHYMGFKAPAAVTANVTLELPDGDGSSGEYLTTNASGVLAWSSAIVQSSQSAVEAETNEDTYVPPDLIKNSPGVAKFWINFDGTSTIAIAESYNVTSIADNGTGDYTVTIATDFTTATWAAFVSSGDGSANSTVNTIESLGTGTIQVKCIVSTTGSAADRDTVCVSGFGDHA